MILKLKDVLIKDSSSVKDAMKNIDHTGLRVTYIVNNSNKLVGVVSDSEIRKSILKGTDIKESVANILNPDPVVMTEAELSDYNKMRRKLKLLFSKMVDSKAILVVDKNGKPSDLRYCQELLQEKKPSSEKKYVRRVLIVGGAGYLGSILSKKLLDRGYEVRVLDILLFGKEPLQGLLGNKKFNLLEGDMRNISTLVGSLDGIDAVINLAAIVGDPACSITPETVLETNFLSNRALAEACKYRQVNRFIYASTCSVYGRAEGNNDLTEDAPLNPVSLYARSKINSEEAILDMEDDNFAPTILRMSTLYGYSPRMRFDLVVNTMTKNAVIDKKITVHGGGKQWRPLLHVDDAAEAYVKCIEAHISDIKGAIFNVGSKDQNYQVIQIAQMVKKCVPDAQLEIEKSTTDPRDYSVSFEKIARKLGYQTNQNVETAVLKIKESLVNNEIVNVNDPKYYNVELIHEES